MKQILLSLILWLCVSAIAQAQMMYPTQYRPVGLGWQVLETGHFKIIYPQGDDSLAYRAGQILEQQYPIAQELIGGELTRFPFVLNNYNDLSNGFVSPFNFRSEIETPPIKGKLINPRTGDWYETVLAHELIHALHFSKKGGVPDVIGWFWRDARRITHAWAPVGMHEGIAVYHESNSVDSFGNGGRLNYPFFTNRFNANFGSPRRWENGQILLPSDFNIPFNRHYIAGSEFIHWLQKSYGEDVTRKSIEQHYRSFFLGYGYALRQTTGKWPGELIDDFHQYKEKKEQQRKEEIGTTTDASSRVIDLPFGGEEVSRPHWINNQEVLFTGIFYDGVNAFYSYRLGDGKVSKRSEAFLVGDQNYDLKNGDLIYAGYEGHPVYDLTFRTQIYRKNLQQRKRKSFGDKRMFAPTFMEDNILALQTQDVDNRLLILDADGEIEESYTYPDSRLVEARYDDFTGLIAVILQTKGVQGVWLTRPEQLSGLHLRKPDVAIANASVFDLHWHKGKLYFTADPDGVMNIYRYNPQDQKLFQITNSLYNAMEPALSPDGNTLAFVLQQVDERKLAFLDKDDFLNREISASRWKESDRIAKRLSTPLLGTEIDTTGWMRYSYSSRIPWIKPRGIVPVFSDVAGTNLNRYGAAILSADVLNRHSYYLDVTAFENRAWYEFQYRNTTFYPGFRITARSEPAVVRFGVRSAQDPNVVFNYLNVQQRREFKLSIPFQYRFRADTRLTSILFEPGLSFERIRFFNENGLLNSDFAELNNLNAITQINWRVMQLRRDLQPRSGLILVSSAELGLNSATQVQRLRDPNGQLFGILRNYDDSKALYVGTFWFLSPLGRYNQSMRLNLSMITQTESLIFNTESLVPLGFDEDVFTAFDNNTLRFSTRYLIPLFYPDKGGITLPLGLSAMYLSLFTHTLGNFSGNQFFNNPRTLVGGGLRFRLRLSNINLDIGAGIALEPSRGNTNFIIGEF